MKHTELKELIRQVVKEESDYQQLFKHMLDRTGKSIPDMSDAEKVKFFQAVDKAAKAKNEGRLTGYNEAELSAGQKKIDVDGDGEIEGSDLAKLRNKNEEKTEKKPKSSEKEKRVGQEQVYDLTIENNHEYFANGVLVHNCSDATRYIFSRLAQGSDLLAFN
jgi:intein/homing endonuclease